MSTVTPAHLTVSEPAAESGADLEPGTALRRHASAFAAFGAAGIGLAGFLTCNWENAPGTAAYLHSLSAKPTQSMISMLLLHYGYLLFVPVAFVLARLSRRRSPRLSAIGLVLSVLGSGLSGLLVTDGYDLSIAQNLPIETAVKVSEGVSILAGVGLLLPTGMAAIVGLVVLMAAMWRSRWVSALPAVLMLVGWAVGIGADTLLRASSSYALVALALVAAGVRIIKMTDAEFASGRQS